MRVTEIIWGEWNTNHITGHGGSVELAEAVLANPTGVQVTAARMAKAQAVIVTRAWTVVFNFEPMTDDAVRAYPITMYPTLRGGRKARRKP